MAKTATIVYWYGLESLKRDGGGIRVLGWKRSLELLGYQVNVVGLNSPAQKATSIDLLGRLKRFFIPMPFARKLLFLPESDIYVITVPAVMASALKRLPNDKLVFDWPDLWSVNARTVGDAYWHSALGGRIQSLVWKRREAKYIDSVSRNAFAGYADCLDGDGFELGRTWLPGPIERPHGYSGRKREAIRTVGFLGNFAYPPNEISFRAFLAAWSEGFNRSGIRIVVAGFGSEIVRDWGYDIDVLGELENVVEFYDVIDAAVVPVEHGGGIKIKAVEAMAFGVPVYGTDHVRSGFSPVMAEFIGGLQQLLESSAAGVPSSPSAAAFNGVFSQDEFTIRVRALLSARSASSLVRQRTVALNPIWEGGKAPTAAGGSVNGDIRG